MPNVTAFVMVGSEHPFHGGIDPEALLELFQNGCMRWRATQLDYSGWGHASSWDELVPEGTDSPYILTDALALYGSCVFSINNKHSEISDILASAREMKRAKMTAPKGVKPNVLWDLSTSEEDRAVFRQLRPLVEGKPLARELVVTVLNNCLSPSILSNLKRLKAKVELCTSVQCLAE